MFCKSPKLPKFAFTSVKENEVRVDPKSHLAYDLSDLDDLRRQGKPISSSNVESLYMDGEVDVSFDFPIERYRGVDINDAWNASKDGQKRLSKASVRQVDMSNAKTL